MVLHKFYLIYHTRPIVTVIPLSVQALGSEVNQHTVWHVGQVHIVPKLSAMGCIAIPVISWKNAYFLLCSAIKSIWIPLMELHTECSEVIKYFTK